MRFELRRRIVTPGESTFVERLPPWRDGESAAAVVLIANPDSEGARRFPVELWRWRTGGADGDLVVARLRGVAGGELVFSTKVVAP